MWLQKSQEQESRQRALTRQEGCAPGAWGWAPGGWREEKGPGDPSTGREVEPWTSGCWAAGLTEQAPRSEALASWNHNWMLAPGAAEGSVWPLPRSLRAGPLVAEQVHCPLPLPGRWLAPCPALALAPNQSRGRRGTAEPSAAGMGAPVAQVPGKGVPWGPGRLSHCHPGTCSHAPCVLPRR